MPTLRKDKLEALQQLVGKETANTLLSSLKERDKMADDMGLGYKSLSSLDSQEQQALLDVVLKALGGKEESTDTTTTEKCTPGTKDGKYMASKKAETKAEDEQSADDAEEDMMEEEDDGEDDGEEMLLTMSDVKAIAGEVAKSLSGSMAEMKSMMMKRTKSTNDDDIAETLKEYTEAHLDFNEQLVSTLEELLTRVKSLEVAHGTGHTPSTSRENTNVQQIYGMNPVQHVENWLFNNR